MVAQGQFYINPDDMIDLVSHFCVVAFGPFVCAQPAELMNMLQPRIKSIVPKYYSDERSLDSISAAVVQNCNVSIYGDTKDVGTVAALQYLAIAQKWPFYGSQVFQVQTSIPSFPPSCLLAINMKGCHLLESGKRKALESISYDTILNWGADGGQLSLAVGNLMQPRRLIFKADPVSLFSVEFHGCRPRLWDLWLMTTKIYLLVCLHDISLGIRALPEKNSFLSTRQYARICWI
eukprot:TRINITY_DN3305_c0_g1_i12.p1 TRINITY_DN3305_c0_g1~~TRINITY_DN3305_c0_g1_i12.p1  ORF type:complete len:234 (-),score=23.52 TRINITY_DN3305_c0_g1_i12:418-1119(-)